MSSNPGVSEGLLAALGPLFRGHPYAGNMKIQIMAKYLEKLMIDPKLQFEEDETSIEFLRSQLVARDERLQNEERKRELACSCINTIIANGTATELKLTRYLMKWSLSLSDAYIKQYNDNPRNSARKILYGIRELDHNFIFDLSEWISHLEVETRRKQERQREREEYDRSEEGMKKWSLERLEAEYRCLFEEKCNGDYTTVEWLHNAANMIYGIPGPLFRKEHGVFQIPAEYNDVTFCSKDIHLTRPLVALANRLLTAETLLQCVFMEFKQFPRSAVIMYAIYAQQELRAFRFYAHTRLCELASCFPQEAVKEVLDRARILELVLSTTEFVTRPENRHDVYGVSVWRLMSYFVQLYDYVDFLKFCEPRKEELEPDIKQNAGVTVPERDTLSPTDSGIFTAEPTPRDCDPVADDFASQLKESSESNKKDDVIFGSVSFSRKTCDSAIDVPPITNEIAQRYKPNRQFIYNSDNWASGKLLLNSVFRKIMEFLQRNLVLWLTRGAATHDAGFISVSEAEDNEVHELGNFLRSSNMSFCEGATEILGESLQGEILDEGRIQHVLESLKSIRSLPSSYKYVLEIDDVVNEETDEFVNPFSGPITISALREWFAAVLSGITSKSVTRPFNIVLKNDALTFFEFLGTGFVFKNENFLHNHKKNIFMSDVDQLNLISISLKQNFGGRSRTWIHPSGYELHPLIEEPLTLITKQSHMQAYAEIQRTLLALFNTENNICEIMHEIIPSTQIPVEYLKRINLVGAVISHFTRGLRSCIVWPAIELFKEFVQSFRDLSNSHEMFDAHKKMLLRVMQQTMCSRKTIPVKQELNRVLRHVNAFCEAIRTGNYEDALMSFKDYMESARLMCAALSSDFSRVDWAQNILAHVDFLHNYREDPSESLACV